MIPLRKVLNNFNFQVNESIDFVANINNQIGKHGLTISVKDLSNIYEISFIKIITSWEYFLETSFISYLCGKYTRKIKPQKIVSRISEGKAYDLLKGTREYPDWTNIADVVVYSNLFFLGNNPFKIPLAALQSHFNEMKTIRNSITHISKKSRDSFMNLVRSKLTSYNTSITPGEFLSTPVIGKKELYLIYYSNYLLIAANQIIV